LRAQSGLTYLHHFGPRPSDGFWPNPLVAAADGAIYGTTTRGGAATQGTLYRLNTNNSTRTVLFEFSANPTNGNQPGGPLIHGSDGRLYGTAEGGTNNRGVIFRIETNGANYTVLRHTTNAPSSLIEASDGRLYFVELGIAGMDRDGANYGVVSTEYTSVILEGADGLIYSGDSQETIRKMNKNGTGAVNLITNFPPDHLGIELREVSHLIQGQDGFLYGLGQDVSGGTGYFIRLDTNGNARAQARFFAAARGFAPTTFHQSTVDGLFYVSASGASGFRGSLARTDASFASTSVGTNLFNWPASTGGEFGANTVDHITEGRDGLFYGTTDFGGTEFAGLLFRVNRDGSGFTNLIHLSLSGVADGTNASPPVIVATNGFLYGTTRFGGLGNRGTIYRLRPDGAGYSLLKQFVSNVEGIDPAGGVIDGKDGFLYGATASGGSQNLGTVFKIRHDGSGFAVMYNMRTNRPGTVSPIDPASCTAALILDTNGWLYGVGATGGSAGRGGVFRAQKDGTLFTNIHNFIVGEARRPVGGLTLSLDGKLWGATENGGANDAGVLYRLNSDGSGFQILRAFGGVNDGANPNAQLRQAGGGVFYGTTFGGGTNNFGTVFRYNPVNSNYAVLHHFGDGADGRRPSSGLVEASDGTLVGATRFGGSGGLGQQFGTLFKINQDGSGYEVLHSFTGAGGDGESVFSTLAKGPGDTFHGSTALGGNSGSGTVFTFVLGGTPVPPPSISTHPVSFISASGGSVTLSVLAGGTPPLTYQWFFRGAAISGATSATLTLTNLIDAAGAYTVRVTNAGGSTNSAPAHLTLFQINPDRSLTLLGEPGVLHRIDFTDQIAATPQSWQPLTNVVLGVGATQIIDPQAVAMGQRFYRGVINP
jgi:uncharacterized repeat protein (TIGR03803 family)